MASFDMSAHVRRINRQDRIATGVLVGIAAFVMLMLAAIVIYILVAGAPKLFDLNFLTGKPQQFKEGGGIGPELFNSFYLLILTLLIRDVYKRQTPVSVRRRRKTRTIAPTS